MIRVNIPPDTSDALISIMDIAPFWSRMSSEAHESPVLTESTTLSRVITIIHPLGFLWTARTIPQHIHYEPSIIYQHFLTPYHSVEIRCPRIVSCAVHAIKRWRTMPLPGIGSPSTLGASISPTSLHTRHQLTFVYHMWTSVGGLCPCWF